jgi:hypothetical protein
VQYNWVRDLIKYGIDSFLLLLISPWFYLPSFFMNKQEKYYSFLSKFMSKKLFRLSYKYVGV